MVLKLHIIRTSNGVGLPLPTYESRYHTGLVLKAAIPTVLKIGSEERVTIPVGFGIGVPDGYCGQIVSLPRVVSERGLIVLGSPQIVHPADRQSLSVILYNASNQQIVLHRGDDIAQMLIVPVQQAAWCEIKDVVLNSQAETFSQAVADNAASDESAGLSDSIKRVRKSVRERTKAADGLS